MGQATGLYQHPLTLYNILTIATRLKVQSFFFLGGGVSVAPNLKKNEHTLIVYIVVSLGIGYTVAVQTQIAVDK